MAGFYQLGHKVSELAAKHTGGRVVGVQEGGYNPSYAAYCLLSTLEGLCGVPQTPDPLAYVPDQVLGVADAIDRSAALITNIRPEFL